jgi:hypothetical protein
VAAGLELPPFKKGYVADLEAFLASHESFISTYPESFERT